MLARIVLISLLFTVFIISQPSFSGAWYIYEHDLTTEDLNFIDTEGCFAVGDNGVVLECIYYTSFKYDPEWFDVSPPTSEYLYGVAFDDNAHVAGTSGVILFFEDLSDWTFPDSPTTKDLYSVAIVDDDDWGFIVGADGTIIYGGGDPPNWELYESSPTNQDLFSVHGYRYNPNCTWAVGAGGTILDYEDGVWSLYPDSPTMEDLYCVFVDDNDDAWACGGRGTILRWDGAVWSLVDTPTNEDLYSVWGSGSKYKLNCVGANGTILYTYDYGSSWYIDDCPVTVDLHGVAPGVEAVAWAVGDEGTIISEDPVGSSIQPISVGKVKALFAPSVEAAGAKDYVKEK